MSSVLFLNRSYWPDTEATGQLLTDLCETLAGSWDVHVVCGQPNSCTDQGYLRQGTQRRNGVTIHRLRHTRFAKRVPAGRLLNLATFSRAASRYLRHSHLTADVVVCETDPFALPVVAAAHAKRTGAALVSYLQDIYPDVAEAIGAVKPGLLTSQIRSRLRSAYRASDRVIVLGSCMQRRLESPPWSLAAESLTVLPNWADCNAIYPQPKDANPFRHEQGWDDRFVVMHSGNMGLTQRLDVLITAAQHPAWPAAAVLVMVGDGAARSSLMQQAASAPAGRIVFLPYQPRAELLNSLSAADLHVVSMHEKISGCLCPSKLYGILAAGRPVLAIADSSTDLVTTIQQHRLGWCCQPGDAAAIANAVATIAGDHDIRHAAGQRARQIACEHFDRPVVTKKFAQVLAQLIDGKTA